MIDLCVDKCLVSLQEINFENAYHGGGRFKIRLYEACESPTMSCFHGLKAKGRACVLGKAITSSAGDGHW